ncbi:AVL9/DENND6 domain-containing protein [Irpex rosettiformis]|uniref:AVL9/DENND6 domain-containing protein n=1 Tax=Irpex rosettiformis TaxID=378272 RepID=A0ACB8TVW8_9APHY|nr:AVL9/DENND6 domain-containing protein [Irpex rosettiformis]
MAASALCTLACGELVHMFRQRTLVLLGALVLQKKIMFYGHPVEKLCTYHSSLVTLVPGLLQNLDDCGSPPLATRAKGLECPTELKTSDPNSMVSTAVVVTTQDTELYGHRRQDSFFQPYLTLQQLDMLEDMRTFRM